jgi:neutral trehalase
MVDAYHTPGRVANILRDVREDELREWLATAIESLWEGPEKVSRVALLKQIRSEIVAAGGLRITDNSQIQHWIRDLEQWKPAA